MQLASLRDLANLRLTKAASASPIVAGGIYLAFVVILRREWGWWWWVGYISCTSLWPEEGGWSEVAVRRVVER